MWSRTSRSQKSLIRYKTSPSDYSLSLYLHDNSTYPFRITNTDLSCTIWVKNKCAQMCAQLCILRADCARVHDVCMCGGVPSRCAHAYTKTELVYDIYTPRRSRAKCASASTIVRGFACIGSFGACCALNAAVRVFTGTGLRVVLQKNIKPNQSYSRSGRLLTVNYGYSVRILSKFNGIKLRSHTNVPGRRRRAGLRGLRGENCNAVRCNAHWDLYVILKGHF